MSNDASAPIDPPAPWAGEWIVACAILILTLPLMIFVAIAIKCDSKGPILVRRPRVAAGRRIVALRFRCTPRDNEFGHPTRIGRLLRFTSIEDLPQLYNVFRGEMTCFPPRAGAVFFLD
jgi:lipopolysaccharide/colanic/teichoic acid biosynthesis glycosyltransferase